MESENNIVENKVISSQENKNSENSKIINNNNFLSKILFYNLNPCNLLSSKIIDNFLLFFCISSLSMGFFCFLFIDKVTSVGYLLTGLFSGNSLYLTKKIRLQASMQQSVSVLKEENNELKENNEELQENIDSLEDNITNLKSVQTNLNSDLSLLKNTIGIFGENSNEILKNLHQIYNNLKSENEIQSNINKNTIYLHILHIIRHFDQNSDFILNSTDLEKVKNILLNAFPNLDYNELKGKIIENKITASRIAESINL